MDGQSVKVSADRFAAIAIFYALAVVAASRTIIAAVLPPLGRELGLSETAIGFLFTTGAFAMMTCGPFWGRLSDRYGRRPIAMLGLISLSVTNLAFMIAADAGRDHIISVDLAFVAMVICRIFFGLGSGATQPSGQAWLIDRALPEHRMAAISIGASAFSLGGVMGPAIGGLLAGLSLLAPFWFSSAAAALAIAGVWAVSAPKRPIVVKGGVPLRWRDPRILGDLIMRALMFSMFAGIQQTAGFFFQDRLHLNAQQTAQHVGIALVGMAIASLGAQALVGRWRSATPHLLLVLSIPIGLGGYLILWAGETFWMLSLGMVALGASFGFWGPATAAAPAMRISAHEQGALAGLSATASGLGFVIGPLLATAIYDLFPNAIFPANMGLLAGMLVAILWPKKARVDQGQSSRPILKAGLKE
jgi:MFS family permease